MTKRYYYTCGLQASYMYDNFGMEFEQKFSYAMNYGTSVVILHPDVDKIYIHPDSVALLEPKVGDLCEMLGGHWNGAHDIIDEIDDVIHFVDCNIDYLSCDDELAEQERFYGVKIIQRDNKPLFWPECEE